MDLRLEHFAAALVALAILALIGAVGIWSGHPWLVPSLGAAAFLQTMSPEVRAAKPWNIVIGQMIAVIGGFAGVYAVGAQSAPEFSSGHPLVWVRIAAVAVAIAITVLLQTLLSAENPTGGATALLVALGTLPATWDGAFILVVGIIMVSALGEAARFMILGLKASAARSRGGS